MAHHPRTPVTAVSSLVGYYSVGHSLLNTGHGTIDGIHYGMYMTTVTDKQFGDAFTDEVAIIYVLDLPFNTGVHLLGASKLYKIDHTKFDPFLAQNGLQKVALEGDSSNFFDMYAAKGQDFQIRSILNPEQFATVEKYCKTQFWELHDSELYFIVTDDGIGNGNIIETTNQFIHALQPALPATTSSLPVVHREVPYDVYDGPILDCPLCGKKMELCDSKWFRCVDGHGVLVISREFEQLYHRRLTIQIDPAKAVHHGPLACPHCHYSMQTVQDHDKKIEVDLCPNCAFSWLDADDVATLLVRRKWRFFGL